MKTAVIGYPRIGSNRELKFATERYLKGQIEQSELLQIAQNLRKEHWVEQDNQKIDYISSNDFSFYDNVLDTAYLLNIIPKRYQELQLNSLDRSSVRMEYVIAVGSYLILNSIVELLKVFDNYALVSLRKKQNSLN